MVQQDQADIFDEVPWLTDVDAIRINVIGKKE